MNKKASGFIADNFRAAYLFFTNTFLRKFGKRYPKFFTSWVEDVIDNLLERKILVMRYTENPKPKFSTIAMDLGVDESNLFKYHKRAVERLMLA